jgi:ribosome-binding protein aMBF1 (putative translation factor)
MSPEQCRAARAWLNWSQAALAAKAQVSSSTVRDFEAGKRIPHANNLTAIRSALEGQGLAFQYADDGSPLGISKAPSEARKRRRGR